MTRRRKRPLAESVLVAESPIHGRGCFARRKIRKGERIGAYEGRSTMQDDTYVLWIYEGDGRREEWRGVDGKNELRYMNHSSRPNTEFQGVELFALRNIESGEELTFHYGDEWAGVE